MLALTRRLALLGAVGAAVLANGAPPKFTPSPDGESAVCASTAERLPASEHGAPQLPAEPPKAEARPMLPPGPRASRRQAALYSAAPPEKTICTPPPAWSVGLRPLSIGMPDLARVEPYLRYFAESPSGRAVVQRWLFRAGQYRHVVTSALYKRHLPLDLQALVYIESGYSPTARSKAGAVGLWQLMPSTAKTLGLRVDSEIDERRSVLKSTDAAVEHLSDLYATFGSWELVFAAYDYGAKRLLRKMREHDAMDYWSLSSIDGALPTETVEYVPKLMAFALLLKNLERFGFGNVQTQKPVFTSELEVPGGTSFALLARAAATSVIRIRELNPEILGGYQVPASVTAVNVPAFGLSRAAVMLPSLIAENDGLETTVPESFDWAHGQVDHKPKAKVAKGPTPDPRYSGFEDSKPVAQKAPTGAKGPAHPAEPAAPEHKPTSAKAMKRPPKRLPS